MQPADLDHGGHQRAHLVDAEVAVGQHQAVVLR